MNGTIYMIKEARDVGILSVETKDHRFIKLKIRKDHRFFQIFGMCKVGDSVEWKGTTHFKIDEVGS